MARGRDTSRAHIGTTLTEPEIDFSAMAESMGVRSFGPVSRGSELAAILSAAVSVVTVERRPVLVDVRTEVSPGG